MNNKGFSSILLVLALTAAAVYMIKDLTIMGLIGLDMVGYKDQSYKLDYLIDACVEDTLLALNQDHAWATSDRTMSLFDGNCSLDVINYGDQALVEIVGTRGDLQKNLYVDMRISTTSVEIINRTFF